MAGAGRRTLIGLPYRAMDFQRISILGVGLLGGSLGLAAKSIITDCGVVGYGHRRASLATAMEIGAIDHAEMNLAAAVHDKDLVVVCTPVGMFQSLMRQMAPALSPGTVITDVGSTKRSIVRAAEAHLPEGVHFVGSHPMAGSEKRGVEYARTDLFQNAQCILTPTPRTNPTALKRVEHFWKTLGMRIARLSPEEHDEYLADISHLPHAAAAALLAMQQEAGLSLGGKGFLDATRIASGDGGLWRDIFLDNRDNLRASIARLKKHLEELDLLLDPAQGEALSKWLDKAAHRREGLMRRKLREVTPD